MAPGICAHLIQILLSKQANVYISTIVVGDGCMGAGGTLQKLILNTIFHTDSGILVF
jgi:hypothetical protein